MVLHKAILRDSLALDTVALVAMRVFGALTGLVYWAVAARTMAAANVGLASGAISAATLLAGLAGLGLGYGLVRHLPHAGNKSALINLSILLSAGAAVACTLVFLATVDWWSRGLAPVRSSPSSLIWFTILTISTAVTQLFHWIFLAAGRITFSLWKMSIQSIAAILLLFVLLPTLPGADANIGAYALSTVLGLAICFWPLLPLALPEYRPSLAVRGALGASFASYSLRSFVADQFQRAPDTLVPLLVLGQFGAQRGAYFFIVWMIGRGMVAWVNSIAESLFAAGSRNPERVAAYAGRAFQIGTALAGALVGGTLLCGRPLLALYGARYAEEGQALLVIIALSALPSVLSYTLVSVLRVQRRLRAVSLIAAAGAGVGLAGCALGAGWGLNGVGAGWLAAQFLVLVGAGIWWRWRGAEAIPSGAHA